MKEFIIECERLGIVTPTKVKHNDIALVTQRLNINTLCELWKWYFNIPPFEKIVLIVDKRLYNSMQQRSLSNMKTANELFYENGIEVREKTE